LKNYSSNYIKIYIWQGLSIILGFLSMFIVTPYLSSNLAVFGIYSVCISVSIFLNYADLGFLSAGQKYAAEEFARKNLDLERKIVGFSGFILLVFVLVCSGVFSYFSIFPKVLIPSLSIEESSIASKLLLILTLSTPAVVIQRVTQMIFSIRIDDYIIQRIRIFGNLTKILSIFFFFRTGYYNIVGYYAFIQIINLIVGLIALIVVNKRYSYKIFKLVKSFKFDIEIFNKTKGLAFTSLFLAFSWIIYYELDNFVIGQLLDAEKIAVYAIGLTLMSFTRTIFGTLFSPFANRFNHYIGLDDLEGLKNSFTQVLSLTFPIVVFTIITIVIFMKPLIYTWVGPEYSESVGIAQFLIACNVFAFMAYPTGILLMAQLRLKEMYLVGAIIPVLYWSGIAASYSFLGLQAFGLFKFISFSISAIVYLVISIRYLDISFNNFFKRFILRNIPSMVLLVVILKFVRNYLPLYKDKLALLQVISFGALIGIFCMLIAYLMNLEARSYVIKIRNKVIGKFV